MTLARTVPADAPLPGVAPPDRLRVHTWPASRALLLPCSFTGALGALALLPRIVAEPRLSRSCLAAAAALLAWNAVLLAKSVSTDRLLTLELRLRKQHYLQACAQGSVLLYWGWYWPPVYAAASLIVAQLLFAYAFDMLLSWSRRDTYALGFGPFPVIFSINLFLWFRPQWFFLQFVMVALGFAAKELITWRRDGRRVHVFNPSSFPLAVFSLVLILTRSSGVTMGQEIADTQLLPPNIYLFLFLIALPGQFFFGVTSMTLSAVVATYVFGLAYYAATGVYYFFDSYVPIAVFLGMHLLFTDPSTSPRTELGRIVFGVAYGLAVVACYALLGAAGVPSFYDKLLPVPFLNLSARMIDRMARSNVLRRFDPAALGRGLPERRRNLAYIGVWAVVFATMSSVQAVGDTHPGHWVPFWQQACRDLRRDACRNLALMENGYCQSGSGWACNEFGLRLANGRDGRADDAFRRACDLGFSSGCQNLRASHEGDALRSGQPSPDDYRILLLEGKGPIPQQTSVELYERACGQGWMDACANAATMFLRGEGASRDAARALTRFDRACAGGVATACSSLGLMYRNGDGVARDDERAIAFLRRACGLGMTAACRWVEDKERSRG